MKRKNKKLMYIGLIAIVVLIAIGVVLYIFVIKPKFEQFRADMQTEGAKTVVDIIMQLTAIPNCQIIPLTMNDKIVEIVAIECLPGQDNK